MDQKATMINQIKEIGRQCYEYIDLSLGLSTLKEVLDDEEVLAFYTTDRLVGTDFRYTDGIQASCITTSNALYQFEFEAASIRYDVMNPCHVLRIEVLEFTPDALLTRKNKVIQMQIEANIDATGRGVGMWLDAALDEVKQLKSFISTLSKYIGRDV